MATVKQYFEANATDEILMLIECSGDAPTQFLALSRKPSGRIDLVDLGCNDTGSDLSDSSVEELREQAREWLRCILGSCSIEEREEIEAEIAPQIEKI